VVTTILVVLALFAMGAAAGAISLYGHGMYRVPDRKVGIVYRIYGKDPRDKFRVRLYNSAGPQVRTLSCNNRYWLMPFLYRVRFVDRVYVPDGTIGLVEALDGRVRPPGRRLGRHVECDYFQDGEKFLRDGGEQGRQLAYLPGGSYYDINPELFHVSTVHTVGEHRLDAITAEDLKEIAIPEGATGVVIALDGLPPSGEPNAVGRVVEGHHKFRLPWVFLDQGGQLGVQEETLDGGGSYTINPWFARVVQIPTRDLHLEWTKKSTKDIGNFDAALDQIVVDIQGHRLSLEMSQVLRIPASAAPRLVRRFGEDVRADGRAARTHARRSPVQRFVERVLGSAVEGYFTEIVGRYRILDFIVDYSTVRMHLQDKVTQALEDWGVVAGQTVLGMFTSEDRELSSLRRVLAGQDIELRKTVRQRELLVAEKENEDIRAAIERVRIELSGEADVVVLRKQVELLGPYHVVMERILAHMSKMPVPTYVSGGNGDIAERILGLMPFSKAQDMLESLINNYGTSAPAPAAHADITGSTVDGDEVAAVDAPHQPEARGDGAG
jgi:SPFH domain / Band 7 family